MTRALVLQLINQHQEGDRTKSVIYGVIQKMVDEGALTADAADGIKKQVRTKLRKKRPGKAKQVTRGSDLVTGQCHLCDGWFDNQDIDLVVSLDGSSQHACKGCLKELDEQNQRPIAVEQLRENVSWPDRHEMRLVKQKEA